MTPEDMDVNTAIPLDKLKPGKTALVERITGGRHLRQKLVNLGMLPGSEVSIVRSNRLGPMVLNVQGSQIMLGAGMASKIYVREN